MLKHIAQCFPYVVFCPRVFQISQGPLFVPGVWGPYLSAMVPDLWLNEGGQSATGRLEALKKMIKVGKVVQVDHELRRKKHSVFLRLHFHQREYTALMND
ncbi:hypothetical protein J4Q44_G00271740 [Coregonus suidteri]|uniref:Uncharacterized protein n=1 Tax=Coregonus suidteri TaxID=861788 RepID=A0AAN8L6W8_9TELE